MFEILWWLIVAHFIGDWALQNRWMADNKHKHWEILFAHCMVYTGVISIALKYLGFFHPGAIVFFLCGHFVVDYFTSKLSKIYDKSENIKGQKMNLYFDHFLHFIQIVTMALFLLLI